MKKKHIKYAVIILNYNSTKDAIIAAKSVIKCAKVENYHICIADNCSNGQNDIAMLDNIVLNNTSILKLSENGGYAQGNNKAIKWMEDNFQIDYIVIMNPDVQLIQDSTVENLIDEVEKDKKAVGGQPLVWTPRLEEDAENQITIRKAFSYSDCIIQSSHILKRFFTKKYNNTIYKDLMPYSKLVKYEVPSGAFFVINREIFNAVGGFDSSTFLYDEELILGWKIKLLNKYFILMPSIIVIHEQGKTTKSTTSHVTYFSMKNMIHSRNVYMKEYLKVNRIKILFVDTLEWINYYTKVLVYTIKKFYHKKEG